MDELNGNGKRGLPKLREILRRQKQDSEDEDSPDIEFQYEDTDSHAAEIAEAYSYTEQPEFLLNQGAFTELMTKFGLSSLWLKMDNCWPMELSRVRHLQIVSVYRKGKLGSLS